ncbi:hypothetical protein DVDV_0654 [Desulfovibrio sp. DV]|nr:hypothetical protein DVDV_0654 [Desulfovibrio sp. DV]
MFSGHVLDDCLKKTCELYNSLDASVFYFDFYYKFFIKFMQIAQVNFGS